MDESKQTNIADGSKTKNTTRRRIIRKGRSSDAANKENTGILKRETSYFGQQSSQGTERQGGVISEYPTSLQSGLPKKDTTVIDDTEDQENRSGSKTSPLQQKGHSEDSDLSEEEQPFKEATDSDYDTDLENMNHDKWLSPEKYEHDTTGRVKYIRACKNEGVQPIRSFLKHMQEEQLVLRHSRLCVRALKALAAPLESNTSIETMDLQGNWLSAEGILHLCRVLRENVYVTQLNLSDNKIGNEGAVAVCNLLLSNKNLEQVNLSGNEIGNQTIEDFYNVLTQTGSALKYLNLRHNNFDDAAAQRFKDALVENESLEWLDLSWNIFQSKGCVLLAEGLKENVGLKELAIAMNGFGCEGGKAIGKALQTNRTLYKLDISYCRLPVECAGEIALGLMHNDKLGVMNVGYNCLDAESALVILAGLQQNDSSHLLFLDFGNTRVGLKFKEIQEKLGKERGLEIHHGGVNEDYRAQINDIDPMEAFKRDPMTKLKEWLSNAGYRLIDLLRHFDKDQSMSISIREFREGIASTKIPLSEEQIQILINKLDQDGDGEIDFSELVEGDKTHRKNKREIEKYAKDKEEKAKEKEKQERKISQAIGNKPAPIVNTEETYIASEN
ncbi:leucine-rich repeat-containing protein [Plakobranchus ocellatus]|uniref:Leucine-rich repeat-containing protein n=1 Tax=Plakobranchus ocellatus TaxID=259542 RepID=A0AAV3YLN6_9GAST|nr:leucine-rich repeat-containing protein [Plakobranchus ocellatus]